MNIWTFVEQLQLRKKEVTTCIKVGIIFSTKISPFQRTISLKLQLKLRNNTLIDIMNEQKLPDTKEKDFKFKKKLFVGRELEKVHFWLRN